ncbi:MAG: hypothetical protein P8O23_07815 [Opitutales bacterium]|nr:hypothetical protein [Opitutales bacterium]
MKRFFQLLLLPLVLISGNAFGQLSLDIVPITQVLVGGGFQISGSINHVGPSDITAGTPIQLNIQIQDPSGTPIMTNPTLIFSGGFSGGTVEPYSVSFAMPWSEDDKWNAAARWRAVVSVVGGGSPQGNITFPLVIPDLTIGSVTTPVSATPGSFVNIQGSLSNLSVAATEAQRFFRIEASIVGSNDIETIIFPDPANFPANAPWPVVGGADLNFTIPNLLIPATSNGTVQVQIQVDPANPQIIPESILNNNTFNHPINIITGDPDIATTVFFDAVGTYQGLDPIKLRLVARNSGTGPITNQNFALTVALSQDNRFSNDDYILREIDMGGGANALGRGLLPNETISVDWIQMLPDNFEGDFYLIVTENRAQNPLFSSSTPEISLRSENKVNLSSVTANQPNRSSKPSTDRDGNYVAFESFTAGQTQIFVQNIQTGQTVRASNGYDGTNPDGSSYAPQISSDGRYVVFHSLATNLVPGDSNNHSDIFLYEVSLLDRVAENNPTASKLTKISNSSVGGNSNRGSFYPSINATGSRVVFESEATNLTNAGNITGGRQIFIFDQNSSTATGLIQQITSGDKDSFDASIDGNGTRIVFTTHADNLVSGEQDVNGNSDVILWENGIFYFAGRNEAGDLPVGGDSKEPVISLDGSVIAFQSAAPNMVSERGISHIEIVDGGLGYTNSATVLITDSNGTEASISLSVNAYGEISGFTIDTPGQGYVDANLTVVPDPNVQAPTRLVSAIPRLVNPQGDVFRISTAAIKAKTASTRISQSQSLNGIAKGETGGNERSREPAINSDGSLIVYSTRAGNLLDLNITSTNTKIFPNLSFRPATAQVILHGGIGKIIVANSGSGYPASGTFQIQDLSGNGSGAVVTYKVDSNGGIGSIDIVNPGSGYDLSQTIISIQNPGTGTGFQVGRILFPAITGTGANRTGGASIQRIEMIDSGIGYPKSVHQSMQTPTILVDGDGVDTDGDGQADSRINSDRIHFGQNGEVYLEQQFNIAINNITSLSSTTLEITDYSRIEKGETPLVFSFANNAFPPPLTISTNDNNITAIRQRLITEIRNQWTSPQDLFEGPQIDNNLTGGSTFTLKALSGRVTSNNPSALGVQQVSNMLIQGSAFSSATARILASPVIHGFSEVSPGMNTTIAGNGRPIFQFQNDTLTDDIYLYNHTSLQNERISVSKFGFPTNYLEEASMPSHRYPAITGDGRYILFSSDAGGLGGIVFNNSNQQPIPAGDNRRRDIFLRDMKSLSLPQSKATISLQMDIFEEMNFSITHGQEMPIIIHTQLEKGYVERASLYVDNQLVNTIASRNNGSSSSQIIIPWLNIREGNSNIHVLVEDNLGNRFQSNNYGINVTVQNAEIMSGTLNLNPAVLGKDDIMIINNNALSGPFTEADLDEAFALSRPEANLTNMAFFESESINNRVPLSNLYPSRANITRSSILNAHMETLNSRGKKSDLEKVIFFLNGKKIKTDQTPPYSVDFSPPVFSNNNKTLFTDWVISAQAVPLKGTSFTVSEFGGVEHEVVFPVSELKVISGNLNNSDIIYEGQSIGLQVSAIGDSDILSTSRAQHFIINGIPLVSALPSPTFNSNGETILVDFYATLNADFAKYAEPDGTIEITALGELNVINNYTPVYQSNSIKLKIAPPVPWTDPTSSAVSLFSDLSDDNLTSNQLQIFQNINNTSSSPIADWTEYLVALGDFQNRIDIHSAHHVTMGTWHESFVDYTTDTNSFVPVDSNSAILWLKSYINTLLIGSSYVSQFGQVPYLVGSPSMGAVYNFGLNRRIFAEQCLRNKFSYNPTFLQMNQASVKMLNFWSQFEPNYWELGSRVDPDAPTDSPPRRDSQTGNSYGAGECAVDLIYRLAVEEKINGFPYISYTEDYRESYYKIGAIMISLWKEKAFPVDLEFIQSVKTKTLKAIIEAIQTDRRYTSRFNLIWSEADEVENAPNWKSESWFGYFMDSHFPWVFHENLGWIYIAGVSPSQFWFYCQKLGWVWTGLTHYPFLYSNNEKGWLYFDKTRSTYYSYVNNSWKSFSRL